MASRLKSLELQGYKTFANRTLFEFSDKVTVIVGPNGSGKSNIADSIRWVLGEQSYSLLRGKRTADMIFSGSEQRARAGMASATITFDNSDGWLPIDFSEVAITRRAYRDGQNEYLINGQRIRLKDVSELLAKSGLAERTYTIIGQGLVDAALALRAEERRRLFEEAAGIGLYRSRREEALKRLDATQRNLDRVQDIMLELEPRLRSLERQARRAKEYEQVKADLKEILREWYGYHWHRTQEELTEALNNAQHEEKLLREAQQRQLALNEKLSKSQARIHELRQVLNSLHRQSAVLHADREKISRELAIIDERKSNLISQQQYTNSEIARAEENLGTESQKLALIQEEVAKRESELDKARTQLEQAHIKFRSMQDEYSEVETRLLELQKLNEELVLKIGRMQIRFSEGEIQLEQDRKSLADADETISMVQKEYDSAKDHLNEVERLLKNKSQELDVADKELKSVQLKVQQVEEQLRKLNAERSDGEAQLARIGARLEILDQADEKLTGYAEGTKMLLQAARKSDITGVVESLNKEINVPVEVEVAIAAVLGEFIDAVILDGDTDIALDYLSQQSTRGVLLPKQLFDGNESNILHQFNNTNDVIGIAAEFVDAPSDIRGIIGLLLGRTLVVRDRGTAKRIIKELRIRAKQQNELDEILNCRVVTLSGDVYYASGPIIASGRKVGKNESTLLGRSRQRKELLSKARRETEKISSLESQIDQLKAERNELIRQKQELYENYQFVQSEYEHVVSSYNSVTVDVQRVVERLEWQKNKREELATRIDNNVEILEKLSKELTTVETSCTELQERIQEKKTSLGHLSLDEYRSEVTFWEKEVALLEQSLQDGDTYMHERQASLTLMNQVISELSEKAKNLSATLGSIIDDREQKRILEAEIDKKIYELQVQIDPAQAELDKIESEQIEIQTEEAKARQEMSAAEHRNAQAKIKLASQQEALDTLRRRIEEDIGLVDFEYSEKISGPTPLPLEGFVKNLPKIDTISPEVVEAIETKRAQLRRIGPINPEAQKEYREIHQRYSFLDEQVGDLRKAENDVREVINELDNMMEREFLKTFERVAEEFKQIFSRLFKGGAARLILTDPDDISTSGIDIEARLPGRRSQRLSLLSGGERSLTSTALVFALLRVSPTPFCLLDEVDAMLDEANLERFRELLLELSNETQFVVVTHNRNTVQAADVIYGVTMGKDSVSQVVSLKPDEMVRGVG